MANHRDHESTVNELVRRVGALKKRLGKHKSLAKALAKAWTQIDGYLGELREVSAALAGTEKADIVLLARWNTQIDLLNSSFAMVEAMLRRQSFKPSPRVASLMASGWSALRAATDLLGDEELSKIEDLELRRLVTVLAERLRGTRLAFSALGKYYQQNYGEGR